MRLKLGKLHRQFTSDLTFLCPLTTPSQNTGDMAAWSLAASGVEQDSLWVESEFLVSWKPRAWQNWAVLSSWEAVCLGVILSVHGRQLLRWPQWSLLLVFRALCVISPEELASG